MKRFILFLSFIACGITGLTQQLTAEQQSIRKVFFDFLKFYQKHEAKFSSFKLYKGTGENNDPPYAMQWKEVDKYFAYLRTSVPYVGEAYIKAEKEHFRFSDSCFKADPEDELPTGFDYDRWAGGQESIDETIKWYTSPKNTYKVTISGNKAELRIGNPYAEGLMSWSVVPFVKEKGKWKMADNVHPLDEAVASGSD